MSDERKIESSSTIATPAPLGGLLPGSAKAAHLAWPAVVAAGAAATLAALALCLPDLDSVGLWSKAELPVLARSRGALGEPLDDLVTSPWLPDYLRTRSFALLGGDLGIRLPHAIASALLVALAAATARARGADRLQTVLVAAFALSFPVVVVGGSTLSGNVIGEVTAAVAVLAGVAAVDRGRARAWPSRAVLAVLALAAAAAAVASAGLLFGLCLPLACVASCEAGPPPADASSSPHADTGRWVSVALWTAATATAAATAYLVARQGDGFVPLLGAAKNLELVEFPQRRDATATLRECGYLVAPWGALAVVGLASRRIPRFVVAWLILSVVTTSLWSQVYGSVPAPLTVPTAIACGAATRDFLDLDRAPLLRRLALAVSLIGIAVLVEDTVRTPSKVASPLHSLEGEHHFPDRSIGASGRLERTGTVVVGGLGLAFLVSPGSRRRKRHAEADAGPGADESVAEHPPLSPAWLQRGLARLQTALPRVPPALRTTVAGGIAVVTVAVACLSQRGLLRDTGDQLSARAPLQEHARRVAAGHAPAMLGIHRIRDDGVSYYGPPRAERKYLAGRSDLAAWLFPPVEPGQVRDARVALIRRDDFPYAFSLARQQGQSLVTLDGSHHDLTIVANQALAGIDDAEPLAEIVLDHAPRLANETNVRFGDYVRLIGWEFAGPVRRGATAHLHMIFEVERPLPTTAKLVARLQKGKLSRANVKPHEFAEGLYPPNYWRKGDYIHHRYDFEISRFETLPGEHELIVAIKKTEKGQVAITDPPLEVKEGDFGVRIPGKEHEFATIGLVRLE